MNPLLSIVIPVYNVEDYVERCVRSCFAQSLPEHQYEVIAINDGTKDRSLEICEKLQSEFESFKIISQENKGLSGARNTGLKNASGQYVWFVDSDDWIRENCLVEIGDMIQKHNADLLWLGHDIVLGEESVNSVIPKSLEKPVSGEEFFENHLSNQFYIWKFVYRREFLIDNMLEFLEGILYEDLEFTPRALLKANTCMTLPSSCYYYLIRAGSIANNIRIKNIDDRLNILKGLSSMLQTDQANTPFGRSLRKVIVHSYTGTIKMAARAGIRLPEIAYELLSETRAFGDLSEKENWHYKLMSLNLGIYHSMYSKMYRLYSLITNRN